VHGTNTCISCHADITKKHPDDNRPARPAQCASCHERQTASFTASVHGLALKAGHTEAATCQDCHDSHEIISDNSPTSPIYYSRKRGARLGPKRPWQGGRRRFTRCPHLHRVPRRS
jgi:nitrate/TMAO reductase-like tetraheme cytochrome c subunit